MQYYASHIDRMLYDNLSGLFEIKLVDDELDLMHIKNDSELNDYLIMIFQYASKALLQGFLMAPCNCFIEIDDDIDKSKSIISNLDEKAPLTFSLTASTTYNLPVAEIIVNAIEKRITIPKILKRDIITALHEILLHSVVYGIFAVKNGFNDIESFKYFSNLLESRLNDKAYSNQRILINANWNEEEISISVDHSPNHGNKTTNNADKGNNEYFNYNSFEIAKNFAEKIEFSSSENILNMRFKR